MNLYDVFFYSESTERSGVGYDIHEYLLSSEDDVVMELANLLHKDQYKNRYIKDLQVYHGGKLRTDLSRV